MDDHVEVQPTRRLRILHLAHVRWFNAEAQYALDLAVEMQRRGHHVTYFTQSGSAAGRRARETGVVTAEEAGFNTKGFAAWRVLGAAGRLRRLLAGGRYDAVEVHRPDNLPFIAWACRRARVPVVRVRGDMRPVRPDPLNRYLYRKLLSGVVASNSAIEESLRERLGGVKRLVTIHGGVDADLFKPIGRVAPLRQELGLPADAYLVGILGRLGRVKGHDDFLTAARAVVEQGVNAAFVILSKEQSSKEQELRGRVQADGVLRDRVRFLGLRGDLPAVLRAFDLGVVASTGSEANCRVGLEWMASGVPLVATRVGVLPDLVKDGETGFLVTPGTPHELGERIRPLALRREESARMGASARKRILSHFTIETCAEAHERFLLGALSVRGSAVRRLPTDARKDFPAGHHKTYTPTSSTRVSSP